MLIACYLEEREQMLGYRPRTAQGPCCQRQKEPGPRSPTLLIGPVKEYLNSQDALFLGNPGLPSR